jgi:hypothetical protein
LLQDLSPAQRRADMNTRTDRRRQCFQNAHSHFKFQIKLFNDGGILSDPSYVLVDLNRESFFCTFAK